MDRLISTNVSDRDALSVCIACLLPRDRGEIVGVLLNERQRAAALLNANELSVSIKELVSLFGRESHASGNAAMTTVAESAQLLSACTALQGALRCSLAEANAAAAWQRPCIRAVCMLSLFSDHSEDLIAAVLGGLVRADTRRIDDVRSSTEDEETDHLSLCQMIMGMSAAVVR